ncbi:MAG TPA: TadE/TadG family type IV pilus assembly protein [Pseudomonadales bacterium]
MNRRSAGIAMVELALVLPLLLGIFFGIVELGRALYQQNMLAKGVANTARMLARTYQGMDMDNACVVNAAVWPAAVLAAENYLRFGSTDADEDAQPRLAGIQLQAVEISAYRNDDSAVADYICSIRVTGQAQFVPVVSDVFGIGAFNLQASAEERYIGE